ncbi:PREDICTED: aquaporin-11 [Leptosomus discolor]|uniref:aquaporin-11 n=1 Tax=Leptosomus discolor TaxID=188344 RepID=UPI000522B26C|nr:PREDICTED: aquaporin-11 [Leptosomus discolor]
MAGIRTSLLLVADIVVTVQLCRRLTRWRLRSRQRLHAFLLEMFSTFQICTCTSELCLLSSVELQPRTALAFTYALTVLHGITLTGTACNPCGTLQSMLGRAVSVKMDGLKIVAQFVAAVLARVFMHFIWSLEMAEPHLGAHSRGCSNPMQTTVVQAFCLELLFSVVFQEAILLLKEFNHIYKAHLIALLTTMLVYAGGDLTGATFNPALAFSLHADCFYDQFYSYSLVYWIAPSLGKFLILCVFEKVLFSTWFQKWLLSI